MPSYIRLSLIEREETSRLLVLNFSINKGDGRF